MSRDLAFLFSKHPAYLIFWVTGACNLACAHCFNHQRNNRPVRDLDLSEIRKISKNMGHIKYLTLAGGEPLLRSDLPDIARVFCSNNGVHMLNLVTNGWLSEKTDQTVSDILKTCPDIHLSVGVSVDGPEQVHDRLRGKEGSYRRALETIGRLKKNHFFGSRLTVAGCGTYNRVNAPYLLDLARFFQEDLAVPYYPGLIRGGNVRDMGLLAIDSDHYLETIEKTGFHINTKLVDQYPFKRARVAVDQVVSGIIRCSLKEGLATVSCKAGKKGFVLTADGDVLLCEILETSLGNVREHGYSPVRILGLDSSRKAMEKVVSSRCHCTWECFQRLNVVFSPELYPRVFLEILKGFF